MFRFSGPALATTRSTRRNGGMIAGVDARLCPRCGAYWDCGCRLEELAPPVEPGCPHDWVEAIGVEKDEEIPQEATVAMCRLCGQYALVWPAGDPS